MKNKVFILICLLVGIAFNSCNCNKTTSSKEQLDTVWNEKVQDTFYGLVLGNTIPLAVIVKTLENQGFYYQRQYSSEENLCFRAQQSRYFTFGGLTWEMLNIERHGDVLNSVCFMNSSIDKASSLGIYNNIKAAVEAKYSPSTIITTDTTVYARTYYLGRNRVCATLSCFRYETIGRKIMIGTSLVYWTKKGKKAANDEL